MKSIGLPTSRAGFQGYEIVLAKVPALDDIQGLFLYSFLQSKKGDINTIGQLVTHG